MDKEKHPAKLWRKAAQEAGLERLMRLRLAAMVGHMQQDMVAARRAALADLLSEGGVYPREEIWEAIDSQLGKPCWGERQKETLCRDLRVLRQGGLRIAYSRRPGAKGYYLRYPPVEEPAFDERQPVDRLHISRIREMSAAEKSRQAFEAAAFALRQKRLVLVEKHPDWTEEEIDAEARRLVYGRHEVPGE